MPLRLVSRLVCSGSLFVLMLTTYTGRALAYSGGGSFGGATATKNGVSVGVGVRSSVASATTTPVTTGVVARQQGSSYTTVPGFRQIYLPCNDCLTYGIYCSSAGQLVNVYHPLATAPAGSYEPYLTRLVLGDGQIPPQEERLVCPPPAIATTTSALPPPPTSAEVLKTVPFPSVSLGFDPSTEGITQLPTWFWVPNAETNFTVGPVSLGGYAVTAYLHAVSYDWSFGDGTSAASPRAGTGASATSASVVHTYHETGTYRVGVSVTWEGDYTFMGGGLEQTVPLGPVREGTVYRDYRVQQVTSVLVSP